MPCITFEVCSGFDCLPNRWAEAMLISDDKAALFHHDAQQRTLAACVGASIALHVLVMFSFPAFDRAHTRTVPKR